MKLPQFNSDDPTITLLQNTWATKIEPALNSPIAVPNLITGIVLSSSSVINHGLNRNLVGWMIVRQRGPANIYDRQDVNLTPSRTLLLSASSGITVDILCF